MRPPLRLPILLALPLLLVLGIVTQSHHRTGGSAPAPADALGPTAPASGALSATWYCAGGTATGATTGSQAGLAEETLIVANPSGTAATGTVTVLPGTKVDTSVDTPVPGSSTTTSTAPAAPPAPVTKPLSVPAESQVRVKVSDVTTAAWASALVETTGGQVVVSQELVGPHGRTVSTCATSPSPTWYFPAGTTRQGATQLLALFNPFPGEATVDVTFDTDAGARSPQSLQGLVIPGGTSATVVVNEVVTLRNEVSTTVSARSGRLIAEQILSTDGTNGTAQGLTAAVGAPQAAPAWVFPDGTTPSPNDKVTPPPSTSSAPGGGSTVGADGQTATQAGSGPVDLSESYALFNPGQTDAEVDVQIVLDDPATNGTVEPFAVTVPAGRYASVSALADGRVPSGVGHWAIVRTTNGVPVVAQRLVEGTTAASTPGVALSDGSPVVGTDWIVPAADVTGSTGATMAIVNPSRTDPVAVSVAVHGAGATSALTGQVQVTVAPGERRIVDLAGAGLTGDGQMLTIQAGGPVVVGQELLLGKAAKGDLSLLLALPVSGTESPFVPAVVPTTTTSEPAGVPVPDVGTLPTGGTGAGAGAATTVPAGG